MNSDMRLLKNYLKRHNISWKPTEEWSLIFEGNHPEGISIEADAAPISYIQQKKGLVWSYRGNYNYVYVHPKEE